MAKRTMSRKEDSPRISGTQPAAEAAAAPAKGGAPRGAASGTPTHEESAKPETESLNPSTSATKRTSKQATVKPKNSTEKATKTSRELAPTHLTQVKLSSQIGGHEANDIINVTHGVADQLEATGHAARL